MRMLDLFSGKKTVSSVFDEYGWDIVTVDIEASYKPTLVSGIEEPALLTTLQELGPYNFIWASPPCECFSVASIGKHWNKDHTPKTLVAQRAIELIKVTNFLIYELRPECWIMENPRGKLRKLEVVSRFLRRTVTYCQYGDARMKPTDLWGGFPFYWEPRKMCKNGDSCHEAAPRGSRTGTQGIKDSIDRAAVPRELIEELLEYL